MGIGYFLCHVLRVRAISPSRSASVRAITTKTRNTDLQSNLSPSSDLTWRQVFVIEPWAHRRLFEVKFECLAILPSEEFFLRRCHATRYSDPPVCAGAKVWASRTSGYWRTLQQLRCQGETRTIDSYWFTTFRSKHKFVLLNDNSAAPIDALSCGFGRTRRTSTSERAWGSRLSRSWLISPRGRGHTGLGARHPNLFWRRSRTGRV